MLRMIDMLQQNYRLILYDVLIQMTAWFLKKVQMAIVLLVLKKNEKLYNMQYHFMLLYFTLLLT